MGTESIETSWARERPDLSANALAHWLELGAARGADELYRKLGHSVDLEPHADAVGETVCACPKAAACPRPCARSRVDSRPAFERWVQSFHGDCEGSIAIVQAAGCRQRLATALSVAFAAPRESAPELLLQVWNIVLNESLLTLSGALDLALVGSLPQRVDRAPDLTSCAVIPLSVSLGDDDIDAQLELRVDEASREEFDLHLRGSITRYLDSFTTWMPA